MLLRCPGLSWWGQSGLRGVPVRERGWQCLLQVPSALTLKCKNIHLEDAAPKTPICSAGARGPQKSISYQQGSVPPKGH